MRGMKLMMFGWDVGGVGWDVWHEAQTVTEQVVHSMLARSAARNVGWDVWHEAHDVRKCHQLGMPPQPKKHLL
jgi:hypothetical protein